MAEEAKDLYETCKKLDGIIANAIKKEQEHKAEIDALQKENARLREVRFTIAQIMHSAKAANEVLAG